MGLSFGGPPASVIPKEDSNANATSANNLDLPVPGAPVSKTFLERARRPKMRRQSEEKLATITIAASTHKIKKTNHCLIGSTLRVNTLQHSLRNLRVP